MELWLIEFIVLCVQKKKTNWAKVDYSAAFVNETVEKGNVNKHFSREMQQRAISFDKSLPRHTGELQLGTHEQTVGAEASKAAGCQAVCYSLLDGQTGNSLG